MKKNPISEILDTQAALFPTGETLALKLLSAMADGWLVLKGDASLRILYGELLERLLGSAAPAEGLAELLLPQQLAEFREACAAEDDRVMDTELELRDASGQLLFLRLRGICVGSGEERRFYLAVFDNTEQRSRQREIHVQLEQYRLVTERIRGLVYLYDLEQDTLYIYGDRANAWQGRQVIPCFTREEDHAVSPRHRRYRETLREILLSEQDFEKRVITFPVSETEDRRKSVAAITLRDEFGHPRRRLCILEDKEEALRERETLSLSARRDQLTGLFNRLACEERISACLQEMDQEHSYVMLFLDLDGFKRVNDLMGHAVGDRVLKGAAEIIRTCFRDRDEVFRLGGDEFVVWMDGHITRELLEAKTIRLNDELGRMAAELRLPPLSVSLGAVRALPGDSFDWLYHQVDQAMYEAKNSGKGRCAFSQRTEAAFESSAAGEKTE